MSVRTELLKDTLLAVEPAICPERAVLLTRSWRETEGQPVVIRRAMGFARILEGMSIYMRPGELIVGNQAITNLSRLSTGDGHIIANYQRAMQGGLRSVIEEARGY